MSLIQDPSGRLHIDSPLMAESLMDKRLLESTETGNIFRPLPELNVIKLGGQSIIDRGAKALLPILDEIVANRTTSQMLVMTGRIPPHRTDAGAFLTAEVLGARRCILVKDEAGLMTADPKKDPQARHIQDIEVNELLGMDLNDLPVERAMLHLLSRARSAHEVLLVNGLNPGELTRALHGENPGSRIYKAV